MPAPRGALRWYYPLVRAFVGEFDCGSHSREVAMRRLRNVLLPLLAIFLTPGFALAQAPAQTPGQKADQQADQKADPNAGENSAATSDEKRLAIAKDVMDEFAHGSLASVRERFDADLKDSVTASDLQDAHDQLFEIAGAFQSQISQATRTVQGAPVYISRSQCAHFKVELRLMFDEANRVIDFRIGPVSDLSPESMEAAARNVADLLHQGQFADVNAKFNARMKGNMPADRLGASWMHVMTHLGPFKSIKSAKKDPDLDRVDVRCEFENGPMIVRVAFDPAGKVSGLWMLPAETEKDSQI
jgi:uncharacterized protein DUF3887